jgi:hypothetical protein
LLCAGTLPAKNVPKNIEIQSGTPPIFLYLVVRAGMSTLPKFRQKTCFFCNFGGHFGDFGCQGPPKVTCRHPRRLRDDFLMIFDGFGSPFRGPGGALWGTFWCMFCEMYIFSQIVRGIFGLWKRSENGAPQGGVDMQSAHAGACFVRVGTCRPGTVLGSILGAFWEPKSTLYSVLVDLGCKLGAQKQWGGRGCVLWCPGCQNGPFRVVPLNPGKTNQWSRTASRAKE